MSAFGKLHEMLQQHAPFPQGLILHSWIGPAEMVDAFAKLQGVYFSLSGHLTRMSKKKYEPMVKRVGQKVASTFLAVSDLGFASHSFLPSNFTGCVALHCGDVNTFNLCMP